MAKIIVAVPCQRIHRFLLPPHAQHVMYHDFPGGGIVLAMILHHLLSKDDSEKLFQDWETKLEKWAADDKEAKSRKSQDGGLPDRFIRLAPFAAAPALKKHLKPNTQFLRVDEKEDAELFYQNVQVPFEIKHTAAKAKFKGNVFLVGGKAERDKKPGNEESPTAWELIESSGNGTKVTQNDIVYILAKSGSMIEEHCRHVRARFKSYAAAPTIIGQIDVDDLAMEYPLQTDTSYERTVGDICRALKCKTENEPVKKEDPAKAQTSKQQELLATLLGENGLNHLIIRIGNAACLVATPASPPEEPYKIELFCHPDRCAPTTFPGLGCMLAYDLLLCAAVVRQIVMSPPEERKLDKEGKMQGYVGLLQGARVGVQATYRSFIEGFGIFDSKLEGAKRNLVKREPASFFADFIRHGILAELDHPKDPEGHCSMLSYPVATASDKAPAVHEPPAKKVLHRTVCYDTACSPNKFWRMVVPDKDGYRMECCLEKAIDHLPKKDVPHLGKKEELPLVQLGKLNLVDRHEVEDYLFLQRLLLSYHANPMWERPLCIGVFGQPGAGKSFGVNQLVGEMSGDSEIFAKESITVNLSQLRSMHELVECFHRIRDACLRRPIPLVFFDEFDSSFEGRTFGWLKYFLAPMQDGQFTSEGKNYRFGKAIFVFAGGVNHSFAEFNERTRNPEFCDAKGPDFISRLRGILNIFGMNKPEGETVEHLYMIKRAVFLRELLTKRLGETVKPQIEASLAEAFLKIPRFKHGVRSLEAILEMSTLKPGKSFSHSNLPPRDQLDMHVDAREFLRLAGVLTPLSNR